MSAAPPPADDQIRAVLRGPDAINALARRVYGRPKVSARDRAALFTVTRDEILAWVDLQGLPADALVVKRSDDGSDGLFLTTQRRLLGKVRHQVWQRERGQGGPADGQAFDNARAADRFAAGWYLTLMGLPPRLGT